MLATGQRAERTALPGGVHPPGHVPDGDHRIAQPPRHENGVTRWRGSSRSVARSPAGPRLAASAPGRRRASPPRSRPRRASTPRACAAPDRPRRRPRPGVRRRRSIPAVSPSRYRMTTSRAAPGPATVPCPPGRPPPGARPPGRSLRCTLRPARACTAPGRGPGRAGARVGRAPARARCRPPGRRHPPLRPASRRRGPDPCEGSSALERGRGCGEAAPGPHRVGDRRELVGERVVAAGRRRGRLE